MRYGLLIIVLVLPCYVEAVSISEVAWMGDSVSANHEWIELYNASSDAVSVEGWSLTDDMNLNISLDGVIPAGAYVVLERSGDDSAPGSYFLIYTGSLVNTGATLVLKNQNGEVVDQVAGGENWQSIGGDNVTKETAQYSGAVWVTDVPTPGAQNRSGRTVVATTTKESGSAKSGSSTKKEQATIPKVKTEDTLAFSVSHQSVAYVGQAVQFVAHKDGGIKNILHLYNWNFGDGNATSGTMVAHTFDYPGVYVVTASTKKRNQEYVVRTEITVVPTVLSVSFDVSGLVRLHNDSPYDIDVSGYKVEAEKSLVFPEHSIIKTGGTITFDGKRLGSWREGVVIFDRAGQIIKQKLIDDLSSVEELSVLPPAQAKEVLGGYAILEIKTDMATKSEEVIYIKARGEEESPTSSERGRYLILVVLVLVMLALAYFKPNNSTVSD